MSTPKKIIQEKKATHLLLLQRRRLEKPRTKKEVVIDNSSIDKEINEFVSDYQDYLTVTTEPEVSPIYGASIITLSDIDDLLTSVKSVSEEEVEYVGENLLNIKKFYYFLKVHPEFYNVLNPILVFDPIIAEEGELIEVPLKETTDDSTTI